MTLSAAERRSLIDNYAAGPARLRAAIAAVPAEALTWRPAPREWSAHEVAVHCALVRGLGDASGGAHPLPRGGARSGADPGL
jgi:hypothetical protein